MPPAAQRTFKIEKIPPRNFRPRGGGFSSGRAKTSRKSAHDRERSHILRVVGIPTRILKITFFLLKSW